MWLQWETYLAALQNLPTVPWLLMVPPGDLSGHSTCLWPSWLQLKQGPLNLPVSLLEDSLAPMSSMICYWKAHSLFMKALTMAKAESPFAESSLLVAM